MLLFVVLQALNNNGEHERWETSSTPAGIHQTFGVITKLIFDLSCNQIGYLSQGQSMRMVNHPTVRQSPLGLMCPADLL